MGLYSYGSLFLDPALQIFTALQTWPYFFVVNLPIKLVLLQWFVAWPYGPPRIQQIFVLNKLILEILVWGIIRRLLLLRFVDPGKGRYSWVRWSMKQQYLTECFIVICVSNQDVPYLFNKWRGREGACHDQPTFRSLVDGTQCRRDKEHKFLELHDHHCSSRNV